jgi:restriction system protein
MQARNQKSPWNPAYPPQLSVEEYENQVIAWLKASGGTLEKFEVQHLRHLSDPGGDYEFDAVAEFTLFKGARIIVLVECKRYSQPVKRDHLMALWAKLQDVRAQKAMMFATCGFQSGALKYARNYGIAAIAFVEGKFLYETRTATPTPELPAWVKVPKFAGIFMRNENGSISCTSIDIEHTNVISEWLNS